MVLLTISSGVVNLNADVCISEVAESCWYSASFQVLRFWILVGILVMENLFCPLTQGIPTFTLKQKIRLIKVTSFILVDRMMQ